MKILCVLLEFPNWDMGRSWSYTTSYAVIDGLERLGHEVVLLPSVWGTTPGEQTSWLTHGHELAGSGNFDQAWIWVTHNTYTEQFWDWLKGVAPVRIGMVMESMTATPDEIAQIPHLAGRCEAVLQDLAHCTHAALCDEADVPLVAERLNIPATWYAMAIPETSIRALDPPRLDHAIFIGTANNTTRRLLLRDDRIEHLLVRPHLPERDTDYPAAFDRLQARWRQRLAEATPTRADLEAYCTNLRQLRYTLFELLLDGNRLGAASVNLPSYFKSYPGRVVEAMAVGVPAISWRLNARPRCVSLFKAGEDILLFDGDDPRSLATNIELLVNDHDHACNIASNARVKLLSMHTAEYRMAQFCRWIEHGAIPDYESPPGPLATTEDCRYYRHLFIETPHWSRREANSDEQSRWERIEQHLAAIPRHADKPLQILDLGCGRGWLSNLASHHGHVTGCDVVPEVIAQARQNFPEIPFLVATAEKLLALGLAEAFDVVITSEVIEHVPADAKSAFAAAVKALTRPGGHVIVSTPRADIREQWETQYGKPAQPVEEWLSEAELRGLFDGFETCGLLRAFHMDIYQIWLFRKSDDNPVSKAGA